jgi:hypothetical protein
MCLLGIGNAGEEKSDHEPGVRKQCDQRKDQLERNSSGDAIQGAKDVIQMPRNLEGGSPQVEFWQPKPNIKNKERI